MANETVTVTQNTNSVTVNQSLNSVSTVSTNPAAGLGSGGQVQGSLGITQNLDVDGSLETDALTINGVSLLETIQDAVGGMVTGNTETGITVNYQDSDGTLDFAVTSVTDENFTTADHAKLDAIEALADVTDTANVVSSLTAGTNITIASDGTISSADTQVTTEQIQDAVGSMLSGNTENGISVTYDDFSNEIDFTVASQTDENFTTADHSKLDGIEAGATADQTASEIRALVESATDSNVFTDADHSKLNAVEASADVTDTTNVVAALTAGSNVTIGSDGTVSSSFTNTQLSSEQVQDIVGAMLSGNTVSGITVTYQDTDGTIDFSVASQTDQNFTNADHSKLDGIEAGATADQSAAEIKALVESATDSNVFTDADHTKLNNIEASADVTDTTNVVAALTAGSNVTIAADGTVSSSFTDTDTTYTAGSGLVLSGTEFSHSDTSSQSSISNSGRTYIQSINLDGQGHVTGLSTATETVVNTDTNTQLSDEQVQDIVGAMVSSNTESGIAVTYDDTAGKLNLTVASQTDQNFTNADHSKLDGIEAGATADQTASEIRALVESATDSNVFTDADHSKLNGIESGAEVNVQSDWNATSGDALILNKPTIPSLTGYATESYVGTQVANLIASAPDDLNTLNELAAALGDDENFATTVTNSIATKAPLASPSLTGSPTAPTPSISDNNTNIATTEYVKSQGYVTSNTQLSDEQVQDIVGAMVSSNTESGIAVTYDDTGGKLNLTVASQTDQNFTNADHSKLDGIETSADVTDTTNVVAALTAGSNVTIAADGTVSSSFTDTDTTYTAGSGLVLSGTEFSHSDTSTQASSSNSGRTYIQSINVDGQGHVTGLSTATETVVNTDTNTQLSDEQVQDIVGAMVSSNTESGIAVTYDDTAGKLNLTVASQTDQNFTNADHTKLNGIESGATADQTAAEIRALVESATDSNVFTDADHSKLNAIEASADVTDTTNVVAALTAGSNVTIAADGTISSSFTDTDTTYTAGSGLVLSGTEFSHSDTSSQSSSANSGRTYIQSINLDGQGHVTGLSTATETVVNTDTNTQLSDEQVQDIVGAMVSTNTESGIAVTYDDVGGKLNLTVASQTDQNFTNADHSKLDGIETAATADQTAAEIRALVESATDSNVFTDADHSKLNAIEASADVTDTTNVVASLTAGSNVTIASDGTISSSFTNTNTQLSDEQVQDIVGAMLSGNTVSGITVSYQDTDGTIDFSVASQTDENFTTADHAKLDGIAAGAEVNVQSNWNATSGDAFIQNKPTIPSGNQIIDWTTSQGSTQIHADNVTTALTGYATQSYVSTQVSNLVDSAPAALDTLNELAAALGDDASFSTTVTNSIATKLSLAGGTMSGNLNMDGNWVTNVARLQGNENLFINAGNGEIGIYIDQDEQVALYYNGSKKFETASNGIDVAGNITISGTVDGRDVATDGTKLDGIEASADVTDTTNVVAALSAGSNVTIAADGTIASSFTDTDTTYTAGSGLVLSGTEFSHSDTSSQSSSANSGRTYIQSINLDGQGHVTGLSTATETVVNTDTNTQLSDEQVQDIVGAMVSSNTESGIAVTYDDVGGKLNLTVASQTDQNFTNADHSKLDGIEASADVTDTTNVVAALTAGSNVTIAADGTVSSSFTNTQLSDEQVQDIVGAMVSTNTESGIAVTYDDTSGKLNLTVASQTDQNFTNADHSKLDGIESGATADQTAAEIRALVESATDSNVFTDADHSKLNAIEASADVTDTTNVVAALTAGSNVTIASDGTVSSSFTNTQLSDEQVQDIVGAMVSTNTESGIAVTYDDVGGKLNLTVASQTDQNFTNADHSKLDGIETAATADQTAAEIRALVESATDSNVFTDADHSKLNAIEASADVTDTTNVVASLTAGSNVTIASDGTISSSFTNTNTQLSDEQVQDIVGAMVSTNTESGIAVTYDDTGGKLNLTVASQTDQNFTNADHSKLDGIAAGAEVNVQSNWNATSGDAFIQNKPTIPSGNQIIDWTTSQGSTQIHADNVTTALTGYATQSYVGTQISNLVDSSPTALNTLNELAAALGDDANFSTTVTNSIATKAPLASPALTGSPTAPTPALSDNNTNIATTEYVKSQGYVTSNTQLSNEQVQDIVGAMVSSNTESGIAVTYDDTAGKLNLTVSSQTDQNFTNADHTKLNGIETGATADQTAAEIRSLVESATDSNVFTDADHSKLNAIEASADVTDTTNVVAALTAGSNVTIAADGTISATDTNTNTQLSNEQVQDIVGAMVSSNTESGIAVTYDDTAGKLNLTVSSQTDQNFTNADHTKLNGIETGATADQTAAEIRSLVESATDSNVFTDADHTKLNSVETSADVTDTTNVVAALTAGSNVTIAADGTISSSFTNTNTQLSNEQVQDIVGAMVSSNTESGIAVTYDDTAGKLNLTVSSQTDQNFTNADHTKLNGIETGATADQSAAEIRSLVESATDSNVFTDADHSKLNAIEASADVTDTTNVVAALTAGSNVTIAADGTISSSFTNTNTQLSNEQVQDIVGAMVASNSESGITVTYQDADGTLDFSVASQTDQNFTNADHTKLDGIESGATADQTAAEIRSLVESATDSNVFTDADHTKLNGIATGAEVNVQSNWNATSGDAFIQNKPTIPSGNQIIDWTTSQGSTQIHADNVTTALTGYATQSYVGTQISNLVASAPSTLDTLNELADALGDDANFSTTVTNSIATKAPLASPSFTGDVVITDNTFPFIRSSTNGAGAGIKFSDNSGGSYGQQGTLTFRHSDTASYGSGASFEFATTESTCTILGGKLMYGEGIYSKPATGTGAGTRKDSNWDTAYGWGDHSAAGYVTSNTQLSTEQVQDAVGAMLSGNTESGITVTYDDTNNEIDFTVASQTDQNFTNADHTKLNGIEASADVTDTTNVVAALTAGSNVTIAADGTISSSFTNTNTQLSNEQVQDIVGAMVASNSESGITVTYQDADGTLDFSVASQTDQNFTNADHTKLNGIESGATADQTAAEVRALVESATDSNVFTDADHTKLNGIATGAEVNVQSNWNATSGDAYIQNKPTIPSGNQIIDWTSSQGSTQIHADNVSSAISAATAAPAAPTSVAATVVGETVDVTFNASSTSNIDSYLVYSSVDGSDYGLISIVPPDDFSATMSVIDNAFTETGTQAYRVYAMKLGNMSSAGTASVSYSISSLEPTNLSVVNLHCAYHVQWDAPSSNSRFVSVYNVYKHEHATQGSLSRSSASLVYSGTNTNFMYQISGSNNNNFHQFWVETTIA